MWISIQQINNLSDWIHQHLAYADDIHTVGENIGNIQKNKEAVLDARKEVGLEANPEKTKHMLMSNFQKAG
jgi:hypothetical protein